MQLYECNKPLVFLSIEVKMLEEYKARYGNELDIHFDVATKEADLAIAPLLLLPFVENCFKHGTRKMFEQPWTSLDISAEDDWLKMKLLNGKLNETDLASKGTGLNNVVRRLELLYPGRYELVINNEEEVFIVNLKIQLEKVATHLTSTYSHLTAKEYV